MPLKDRNGNVLAVVEAVNKLRGSSAARVQTPKKMLPARATSSERHASSTVRCKPCPTVNQRPDLMLTPFIAPVHRPARVLVRVLQGRQLVPMQPLHLASLVASPMMTSVFLRALVKWQEACWSGCS